MSTFYISILKEASERTCRFANRQGIFVATVLALLGIGYEVYYTQSPHDEWINMEHAIRLIKSGLIPVIIVVLSVFLYQLFDTPQSVWAKDQETISNLREMVTGQSKTISELETELKRTKNRIRELGNQLPAPVLTPEQEKVLKAELEKIGRLKVSIVYYDYETYRPGAYAWSLTKVFRSAFWHVEIRGVMDTRAIANGVVKSRSMIFPCSQKIKAHFKTHSRQLAFNMVNL